MGISIENKMSETVERVTPGTRSWEQYGAEHMQRYEFFSNFYAGKHVVDAACGTGYGSAYIASKGATSVTGFDIDDGALGFADRHYSDSGARFVKLDCEHIADAGIRCDVVVSFETIEHLRQPDRFVKGVASILNPGGTFICSTPNPARLSGAGNINPFHPSEMEWEPFRRLVGQYFTVTAAYHQTESYNYLRYLHLRHLLHQETARQSGTVYDRIETLLRKIAGRPFRAIPFFHSHLEDLQPSDIVIEPMGSPAAWHKTFIVVGTLKGG